MNERLTAALAEIEARWHVVAGVAIAREIAANPSESFYAAGFWLFYTDGHTWSPPLFAINSESGVSAVDSFGEDNRWNPTEWRQPQLTTVYEAMLPAYLSVSEQLRGDKSAGDEFNQLHEHAMARVCRNLTRDIRTRRRPFSVLPMHPRFVVGIFDGTESRETASRLARLSIEPANIDELEIPFLL